MLGTSDAWSMSRLSHGPSDPAYYIEDLRLTAPSKTISSYCGYFFQTSSKGARLFFKEGTYTFAKMESGSEYDYND